MQLQEACKNLKGIDLLADDVLERIFEVEIDHDVMVEIYSKNPVTDEYTDSVYSKSYHGIIFNSTNDYEIKEDFNPVVGYSTSDFELFYEYDDNSFSGILRKDAYEKSFFVFVSPSDNGNYIYVTAVDYSLIDSMVKSISRASVIIAIIIFIAVSIAVYFYISRITKPLDDIVYGTKIMAEEKDKNIRIPVRKSVFRIETEDAIVNINTLYESLMLTQERLLEKSEVLAAQLEEKDIEQKSRAKFIADTSHELKTPISIIQGYAEGIKYVLDDKEATSEYCDTIIEECGRMTDLVVDMMSLSNIQHADKLELKNFLINDFIDERMKLHTKIFDKNGIYAINSIKDKFYGYADVSRLQFVFNNLISNAVSYIGGEERVIEIHLEEMETYYRIYVFNTGDPVPQEDVQKLWDSFYRRDAARLRSEGHFGLGLSIVKAVQDAHSQQCGVNNTNGGVEFWFDIAKGNPPKAENE